MDDREHELIAKAMAALVGHTDAQVVALVRAMCRMLVAKGVLDGADIVRMLDDAAAICAPGANRCMIDHLRMGLVPGFGSRRQ